MMCCTRPQMHQYLSQGRHPDMQMSTLALQAWIYWDANSHLQLFRIYRTPSSIVQGLLSSYNSILHKPGHSTFILDNNQQAFSTLQFLTKISYISIYMLAEIPATIHFLALWYYAGDLTLQFSEKGATFTY